MGSPHSDAGLCAPHRAPALLTPHVPHEQAGGLDDPARSPRLSLSGTALEPLTRTLRQLPCPALKPFRPGLEADSDHYAATPRARSTSRSDACSSGLLVPMAPRASSMKRAPRDLLSPSTAAPLSPGPPWSRMPSRNSAASIVSTR